MPGNEEADKVIKEIIINVQIIPFETHWCLLKDIKVKPNKNWEGEWNCSALTALISKNLKKISLTTKNKNMS